MKKYYKFKDIHKLLIHNVIFTKKFLKIKLLTKKFMIISIKKKIFNNSLFKKFFISIYRTLDVMNFFPFKFFHRLHYY